MTSMCYLIGCVNLLYTFVQVETCSPSKILKVRKEEKKVEEEGFDVSLNTLTPQNQDVYLAKTITPYWNYPYDEQLKKKQNSSSETFDSLVESFKISKIPIRFKILQIVPSPLTKSYRNKDEFFIRYGVDGNPKTVGCTVGNPKFGRTYSIPPTKIVTIKEIHKRVAKVYEDFIRSSPLPPSIKLYDKGHWNTLLVRSNEVGEIMASVTVKPKGYAYDAIHEHQQALKQYFFKRLPYITLYHQVCSKDRCNHSESPFSLLYGKRYIIENLNGYKFKISPDTIFPINKVGTEVLYDTIIRTAKININTTVLDIFSGTGMNCIMVSKFVREAIGLDSLNYFATEAKHLAHFNNIHNIKFKLGRIHIELSATLRAVEKSSDVVALLNYRTVGVVPSILRTLRRNTQISRLIYVFWRPRNPNAVQNVLDLCSTNNSKIPPFTLTKIIPIDLLPQTAYVEYILFFQRKARYNLNKVSM